MSRFSRLIGVDFQVLSLQLRLLDVPTLTLTFSPYSNCLLLQDRNHEQLPTLSGKESVADDRIVLEGKSHRETEQALRLRVFTPGTPARGCRGRRSCRPRTAAGCR